MTRIPALTRDEMDEEQKRVHDDTVAQTGRVGRGPAVGYAYAPGMWETNNSATDYFENRCSLTLPQLRLVALLVARRWNAPIRGRRRRGWRWNPGSIAPSSTR